jgi:hypothetical protein
MNHPQIKVDAAPLDAPHSPASIRRPSYAFLDALWAIARREIREEDEAASPRDKADAFGTVEPPPHA